MPDYQLYCFAQSGNCYRTALMLNLIGAKWEPIWIDFFGSGVQRTPDYREGVNEMGEVPVLLHGDKKLTSRPSPTFRSPAICIIRPRNSVSISSRIIRRSGRGSTA